MATSLTTRKMSPELKARVEASVRGGRRTTPGAKLAARSISLLRLGVTAVLGVSLIAIVLARRSEQQLFERERTALLDAVGRETASLSAGQPARVLGIPPLLERFSSAYPGDFLADELQEAGAFQARIALPALYVRGPLAAFRSAAGISQVAASSFKDAFVLCLLDPPDLRTEQALRSRARSAQARGERVRQHTGHVERLHDALAGLAFLSPDWRARVEATETSIALNKLRQAFERAPLGAAKRASRAETLLFAMDEPGEGPGPTELDGERAHLVRVGLVDLASQKVLLRLRRPVDPSWISAATRAEYASGIDSCSLALDVRAIAMAPPKSPKP